MAVDLFDTNGFLHGIGSCPQHRQPCDGQMAFHLIESPSASQMAGHWSLNEVCNKCGLVVPHDSTFKLATGSRYMTKSEAKFEAEGILAEYGHPDYQPEEPDEPDDGLFHCACGYTSCGGGRGCGGCADCHGEHCECFIGQPF
jgi:hypothetical protein